MEPEQRRFLESEILAGGAGYVRGLAGAEAAVLRGQFNLSKVLRALAHAQRAQALAAARLLGRDDDPAEALRAAAAALSEFPPGATGDLAPQLERLAAARRTGLDVAECALASLWTHPDVMEDEVAQILWGCYGCGAIVEGDTLVCCPVCGALASEFERFGPFYIATPEHLGQLTPAELLAVLAGVPGDVVAAIAAADEAALERRPSAGEWCVKEIVGHMLETDLLFQRAVRTILAADGLPRVEAAAPWTLHEGKGYEVMPLRELLERLRETRDAALRLLGDLPAGAWVRRGAMRGVTPSLIDLGTWLANHDRGHLAQIRHLCAR